MEKLLREIHENMAAVGSIVNSSDKFTVIFLQGALAGDILNAIERLEENDYTLIDGVRHTAVIDASFEPIHYYSATLRKK